MACSRNTVNCTIRRGIDRPPCCIEGFKNLLFYITDLLDKNDIIYWLDYGTLLGAVRDGELISWDTDVDIGILGTDVEKILGLFLNDCKSEYDYAVHMVDEEKLIPVHHIYVFYSKLNRLSLEISVWATKPGCEWQYDRRWYGKGERASGKAFSKLYIYPCDEIEMYNRKFKCPNKVEQFLEFRYGLNWRTPARG